MIYSCLTHYAGYTSVCYSLCMIYSCLLLTMQDIQLSYYAGYTAVLLTMHCIQLSVTLCILYSCLTHYTAVLLCRVYSWPTMQGIQLSYYAGYTAILLTMQGSRFITSEILINCELFEDIIAIFQSGCD